ncbi:MAG: Mov34/MPN/PAD-1 family protein [Croceibacterium sp.]
MEIVLTREAFDRICSAAARASSEEACGLLLGRDGRIEEAVQARNVHSSPRTHFEIDPQALIDAHRAEREGGPHVIGYYHSHPLGPPAPSENDRAMASGDGRVWAIVGEGDVTFWRDDEDGFAALSYSVTEG